MAAGIGARYGGVKQLEPVGPSGEIIISYSIHDAIRAGFDKVVVILRRDIKNDFDYVIGNRLKTICRQYNVELKYAYQDLRDLPDGHRLPSGRTKPWGTGQAVLACRDIVQEPFVIINSDDYYGPGAMEMMYRAVHYLDPNRADQLCMAGYVLKNTLSDNGSVTRGVCEVDEEGMLLSIVETCGITQQSDGRTFCESFSGHPIPIDPESIVSMNMWGMSPAFMDRLYAGFDEFLQRIGDEASVYNPALDLSAAAPADPEEALSAEKNEFQKTVEFLIPEFIGCLVKKGEVTVKVLGTEEQWLGVTYRQDRPKVVEAFRCLIDDGRYPENLYESMRNRGQTCGKKIRHN
jgi:dTDP-glucose pyrophosphorylase